jgi:hypothetical protein
VASGLDQPRGVVFFRQNLMVAESGHGGDVCDFGPPPVCTGMSSQISTVNRTTGQHTPLVTGLYSSALFGTEALGAADLSVHDDHLLAVLGESTLAPTLAKITCGPMSPPDCPAVKSAVQATAGRVISITPNGQWKVMANVGAFDFNYTANPPPGMEQDANPYGLLAVKGGAYVADAGANTLDFASDTGKVSVIWHDPTLFPDSFPKDAVQTCVTRANGVLWVTELSGRLFRVDGTSVTQVAVVDSAGNSLLQHVTGCAASKRSGLYLVNMWTNVGPPNPLSGNVVRFRPGTGTASVIADKLNLPNKITVGPDALYVSANSTCPATGGSPDQCTFMGQTSGLLLRIQNPSNEATGADDSNEADD